jgi:hypothetical protein
MSLALEAFKKIFENNIGHGGNNYSSNCYYQRINVRDDRLGLTYIISVYRNSELWKTFWIDKKGIDARILENWNKLTERQKYQGTQKEFARYSSIEDFEKILKELKKNIFN